MNKINNEKLQDLCTLSFGHYLKPTQDKGISYLQVKNFTDEGEFLNNVENFVQVKNTKSSFALEQDDILFVSKGMRFFAHKYDISIGLAVASSIFYVIKVDSNKILADYLTCILNHPKSMAYFNGISAGSSIPSIRKKELLDFEIPVPSKLEQVEIVNIYNLHSQQQKILTDLKDKKQLLFNQIINELTENKL